MSNLVNINLIATPHSIIADWIWWNRFTITAPIWSLYPVTTNKILPYQWRYGERSPYPNGSCYKNQKSAGRFLVLGGHIHAFLTVTTTIIWTAPLSPRSKRQLARHHGHCSIATTAMIRQPHRTNKISVTGGRYSSSATTASHNGGYALNVQDWELI